MDQNRPPVMPRQVASMRKVDILEQHTDALARVGFRKSRAERDPACLPQFYAEIPFRYPSAFESLCLQFAWHRAAIGPISFSANPPGPNLDLLGAALRYNGALWDYLIPRGYLIVGRPTDESWDPCAFDMNRRSGQDAPLVRIDHEEILSQGCLGMPTKLADSFDAFVKANLRGARA